MRARAAKKGSEEVPRTGRDLERHLVVYAALLVTDPESGRIPLGWLGSGPTQASPAAVKAELEKLAYLRRLGAQTLDLSALPAERRRFLAGIGRRLSAQALSRRDEQRRYPILLTLVAQSAVDVLDECLLLFDQTVSGREAAAKTKMIEAWPSGPEPVRTARHYWTRSWPSSSTRPLMTRGWGGTCARASGWTG